MGEQRREEHPRGTFQSGRRGNVLARRKRKERKERERRRVERGRETEQWCVGERENGRERKREGKGKRRVGRPCALSGAAPPGHPYIHPDFIYSVGVTVAYVHRCAQCGGNAHKQRGNVPRQSRARSDAAWRRRRELDRRRLSFLSTRPFTTNVAEGYALLFCGPRVAFSPRKEQRDRRLDEEIRDRTEGEIEDEGKRQGEREMWECARERKRERKTPERERREEGKGGNSGAARERTFVIAARVTRCPRSVATPPDARQSSVRRATVVSETDRFSNRLHFALVLRRIRVSSATVLIPSSKYRLRRRASFPFVFPPCKTYRLPRTRTARAALQARRRHRPDALSASVRSVRSFSFCILRRHDSLFSFLLGASSLFRCVLVVTSRAPWTSLVARKPSRAVILSPSMRNRQLSVTQAVP